MNNDIIKLLNIIDKDIEITKIDIKDERKYNRKFKMYLSIYQLENMFFNIDPNLKEKVNLKQLYIDFNNDFLENDIMIESRFNYLINLYKTSKFDIFREFANLLLKHKKNF